MDRGGKGGKERGDGGVSLLKHRGGGGGEPVETAGWRPSIAPSPSPLPLSEHPRAPSRPHPQRQPVQVQGGKVLQDGEDLLREVAVLCVVGEVRRVQLQTGQDAGVGAGLRQYSRCGRRMG